MVRTVGASSNMYAAYPKNILVKIVVLVVVVVVVGVGICVVLVLVVVIALLCGRRGSTNMH